MDLRTADLDTLLRAAYSLTHQMHNINQSPPADRAAWAADLRAQRDLISEEIARRCENV